MELLILALLSQSLTSNTAAFRSARACLAVAAACQIAFLLWIPYQSAREAWKIFHTPPYQTSAAELWDTDLSKYGTRDIDANVSSLIRHPNDIVVPAIYSNRGFAADTLLEFGGRLLPLSDMLFPFMETHGRDGANYRSSAPFVSSGPLRIVLVAPDPYSRADFQESTQRIMRRFAQVTEWTPGPVDPHGRVWIWTGEITEPIQAPAPRGE